MGTVKAPTVELLLFVYDANGSLVFARGKVAKALGQLRRTNVVGFARKEFDTP